MSVLPANGTLISGIADISALLSLLGTDQVESHLGSALSGGYLYAAAASMSVFGSLGAVKSALKIVISCSFIGAKWLADAGLSLDGDVARLIGSSKPTYIHRAEKEIDSLIKDKTIRTDRLGIRIRAPEKKKDGLKGRSWIRWNYSLVFSSLFFAAIGYTPYVYLLQHAQLNTDEPAPFPLWAYPLMRTLGTALAVICSQAMLQLRLLQILRKRIFFLELRQDNPPREIGWNCVETQGYQERKIKISDLITELHQDDTATNDWINRAATYEDDIIGFTDSSQDGALFTALSLFFVGFFAFIGAISTVIGYVGSFLIVQSNSSGLGPIIWLGTEGGLSLIRLHIWGVNPHFDSYYWLEFFWQAGTNANGGGSSTNRLPLHYFSTESMEVIDENRRLRGLRIDVPRAKLTLDDVDTYYTLTASTATKARILYVIIYVSSEPATSVIVKMPNARTWKYFQLEVDRQNVLNGHGQPEISVKIGPQITNLHSHNNVLTRNPEYRQDLANYYRELGIQLKSGYDFVWCFLMLCSIFGSANDELSIPCDWSLKTPPKYFPTLGTLTMAEQELFFKDTHPSRGGSQV